MGGGVLRRRPRPRASVVDTRQRPGRRRPLLPRAVRRALPTGAAGGACASAASIPQRRGPHDAGRPRRPAGLHRLQRTCSDLLRQAAAEGDKEIAATVEAFHYRVAKEDRRNGRRHERARWTRSSSPAALPTVRRPWTPSPATVGWIAPVTVYPGEGELLALAQGALRVLNGEEPARVY